MKIFLPSSSHMIKEKNKYLIDDSDNFTSIMSLVVTPKVKRLEMEEWSSKRGKGKLI